jgi:hypothetical protein
MATTLTLADFLACLSAHLLISRCSVLSTMMSSQSVIQAGRPGA